MTVVSIDDLGCLIAVRTSLERLPLLHELLVALADHEVHRAVVVLGLQSLEVDLDARLLDVGSLDEEVLVLDRELDTLLHELAHACSELFALLGRRGLAQLALEGALGRGCVTG